MNFFSPFEVKILSQITGKSEVEIWLKKYKLTNKETKIWQKLQIRLQNNEPLDYLLGKVRLQNGLELKLDKNVLIPRPETEFWLEKMIIELKKNSQKNENKMVNWNEIKSHSSQICPKNTLHLADTSLEMETLEVDCDADSDIIKITKKNNQKNGILVEIGCGSGVICLTLAGFFDKVVATDKSKKALDITKQNAILNNIKIEFIWADLLNFDLSFLENADWTLVANLPYLPQEDLKLATENNVNFEPKMALYSGESGLNCFEKLVKTLKKIQNKKLKINRKNLKKIETSLQKITNSNLEKVDSNLDDKLNNKGKTLIHKEISKNIPNQIKKDSEFYNLKLPREIWLELDPRNIRLAKKMLELDLNYTVKILKDYNNLERVLVCKIK